MREMHRSGNYDEDRSLLAHLLPPLSPKSKWRKVDSLGRKLLNKDSENSRDLLYNKGNSNHTPKLKIFNYPKKIKELKKRRVKVF